MNQVKQCCLCGAVGHDSKDCGFQQWAEKNLGKVDDAYHPETRKKMWDIAQSAWQAARAQPVDDIDTLSERVEKHCENRHDCQHAGEAVAVLQVVREPDYFDRGHYHQGYKPYIDPLEVYKLPIGTKLYTIPPAPPVQVPDSDGARRIANLLNIFSKQFGKNDDAEGLLEFYGRTHYEHGVEDGSRNTPYGWQIVPKEPTAEMIKAIDQHGEYYSEESLKDAYMDMLSAAPQPKVGE